MAGIIVVIITVVVLLTGPALAAEPLHDKLTNQPSWTGLYVGGHLGYGWDRAVWTSISAPSPVVDYSQGSRVTSHPISGVFGGGHLGVNYQLGSLVSGSNPHIPLAIFTMGREAIPGRATMSIPRGSITYSQPLCESVMRPING